MEIFNTGLVRHVDDLGRVVIPKELRNYLLIKDGDPLDVCLMSDKSGVVFRRCEISPISEQFLLLAKSVGDVGDFDMEAKVRSLMHEYLNKAGRCCEK